MQVGNNKTGCAKTAASTLSILTAVLLSVTLLRPTPVQAVGAPDTVFIEGELLIQLEPGKSLSAFTDSYRASGMRIVQQISKRMNIWLVAYDYPGFTKANHRELLNTVRRHPSIAVAQFNHRIKQRATIPDDPSFNQQWGLHNTGQSGGTVDADIDAPEAWDLTTGGITSTGDSIIVAVIDGGFDLNHVDIPFWRNNLEIPNNGIDDDANGYIDDYRGWNAYNNTGNLPSDDHGTHVSGIAAAKGNNGVGVSGVNWGAKVMPVAGSTSSEAVAFIAYSYVQHMRALYNETNGAKGAFVVSTNSSFGVDFADPDDYPLWCSMYDSLGSVGILSACATANLNINVDTQGDVPTACPSPWVVAVTNTTRTDARNSGAAFGATQIDLGSPGTSVYSTLPGNTYGSLTGTSMATPHVAGAIALMYAGACPSLINQYKADPGNFALQFKDWLLDGTDPKASMAGVTVSGGRLNVFNSLLLVQAFPCGVTVFHDPLPDVEDTLNPYDIVCEVISENPLNTDSLFLYYTISASTTELLLTPTGGDDEYHAYIPAQEAGTEISYYFIVTDIGGMADTSDIFSFKVRDYGLLLTPGNASKAGASMSTVTYQLTVTNDAVLADSYDLSVSGANWSTSLWDSAGFSPVASSPSLNGDQTFAFQVQVDLPSSVFGQKDTVFIVATSTGNPSVVDTTILTTTSEGAPLAIPLDEPFPVGSLDPAIWVQNSNATVSSGGLNQPSPPYVLNLNASPSGADTVVTQIVDLSGASDVALQYYYERTGNGDSPETGDDLYFEYRDTSGNWQLLSQLDGAGADMIDFDSIMVWLPEDAYGSLFKLRIRSKGSTGDDWFVDNLKLFSIIPPEYSAISSGLNQTLNLDDSAFGQITITNLGQAPLAYTASAVPTPNRSMTFERLLAAGLVEPAHREYADDLLSIKEPKGDNSMSNRGQRVDRDGGGPDAFGYYWIDSDEPGGPVFNWQDISATGTNVIAQLNDDNATAAIPIGFDFPFYGNIRNQVYIGSNGIVGFASTNMSTRFKTPLPSISTPNDIIAWLWDDLNPDDATNPGAAVYYQTIGDKFIIQFQNYPEYQASAGDVITAQIILGDDGSILIQYLSVGAGFDVANCTVGIENSTGTDALEVAYLTSYVKDSLAVQFYQPYQWVTLNKLSGVLEAGESDTVVAKISSVGLSEGDYSATIRVVHNDPDDNESPDEIPVHLSVTEITWICGDVNGDTHGPNILDVTALVSYLFAAGPPPPVPQVANVDGVGLANILDVNHLVAYLFSAGAPLNCQ